MILEFIKKINIDEGKIKVFINFLILKNLKFEINKPKIRVFPC
jgi:hypothetical protein